MPPKATSASKAPKTEAEDSASDRDDHEERITALETTVQSMNSKLDQILASLAVQRLPSPPEAFKSLPKPSSTAEATTRDIGLFDPSNDAEAVRSEKQDIVYGDVTLFANKLRRVAARKIVHGYTIGDCLRGSAIAWYEGANPEELEQAYIEQWCTVLLKQFRLPREVAVRALKKLRYTISDATNAYPLTSYFDQICRCTRALDYTEQQTKDYVFDNVYTEIAVQLEDLKPLSLIEIRPRLAQRQILISNFAQQVFGRYLPPPRRIEGPVAEFQQEAKMPAEKRDWKRKKDDRRTYFMKAVTDEADREDEFNITV